MRKLLATVLVTISLGGCAQMQTASNLLTAATKTYDNPVTEQELYQIEASFRIAVEALLTYRRACLQGTADLRCRENIEAIHPYTKQIKPLLLELRQFVRTEDRVNGIVIYKRLANLYNTIITAASARGVNLGA